MMKYDKIFHMDGFVLIDKEEGLTSTQVDGKIKKFFHTKKVGHVGTLDPFATGLLIIGVNKGTKAITFFDDFTKEYVAAIKLGVATDSMDKTSKVIEAKEVPNLSKDKIEEVLHSFLGKSKQLPPMTSAIHVNGTKLYKLAHQGIEVERPLRDIVVYEIELIKFNKDEITFRTLVSKGTYIRVLGSDIAKRLNTVGHLSELRRTKVGPFSIENATHVEDLDESKIVSSYNILKEFADVVTYSEDKISDIKNGKIKYLEGNYLNDKLLVVDASKEAIAMYKRISDHKYQFVRGLF